MKTKYLLPVIPTLLVSPLFAATPAAPDRPGYTLTDSFFFKNFELTDNYIYDSATWSTQNFRDGGTFRFQNDTNPSDKPTDTVYDSTSVTPHAFTEGLEITSSNRTFTIGNADTLSFDWLRVRGTDVVITDGARLNIADVPPAGAASNNWFDGRNLTLSNGATIAAGVDGNKEFKMWGNNITATDSTIIGGISAWHAGTTVLTNTTWTAKGTTFFQYHGNANYSMTLDNSHATLQANNVEGTAFNDALRLYAHNATSTAPVSFELKNGSTFVAGTLSASEHAVIAGGMGHMGWGGNDNKKITIDVNTGSKLVMGAMTVGADAVPNTTNADIAINVSGTGDSARSMAAFTTMNMTLSANASATADSFKTAINGGDYVDLRMNGLNMVSNTGAQNGKTSITLGSNSTFYVLSDGYGGDANIGQIARAGGLAEVRINGENTVFYTHSLYLGNTGSTGGQNVFEFKNASTAQNTFQAYGITLRNTSGASSQKNQLIFAGNTLIKGNDGIGDTSIRFRIGSEDVATGGTSELILQGEGVRTGYLIDVLVGNAASTGGTSIFSVQGSDIKKDLSDHLDISRDLIVTASGGAEAILEFVADANGFSKISAATIDFTGGTLALNFADITTGMGDELIQFRNTGDARFADWEEFCNNVVNGTAGSQLLISGVDAQDTLTFSYNNGILSYSYDVIPEPGTYAAIFGALALALAVYRRKRN